MFHNLLVMHHLLDILIAIVAADSHIFLNVILFWVELKMLLAASVQ